MNTSSNERRQIVKNSVVFLAGTIVGVPLGILRSVVFPLLFTPAQLGVWNLMNVILNYGSNAHLGILHGMNKAIPLLRGQDNIAKLEEVKDNVFWFNLLLGAVAAVCVGVISLAVTSEYGLSMRITALTIFFLVIFGYLFSLLRADNRFILITHGTVALSVLSTFLVILLAFASYNRLSGALIGLAIAYALVVIYWFQKGRYHFALRIKFKIIREMLIIGLPLISIVVLDGVLLSVDRWMIAANLGTTMLGYYALGIMASNLIGLVPGSIASVLYPKMLERFGASGNPSALRSLFVGPTRVVVALLSLLIGGVVLTLPFLIKFLLPKYLPSVSLFGILISAAFFYAVACIPGSFMVSINRQKMLIIIQIIAIILALVLDFVVVQMRWGIVGIAWSTAFAYAVYGGGYMVTAAYFAFERRVDRAHFLIEIYGVFAAMVLGLVLAMRFIPEGANMGKAVVSTALRLACFLVVLLPVLWWSNRHAGLLLIAREMFPSHFKKLRKRILQ